MYFQDDLLQIVSLYCPQVIVLVTDDWHVYCYDHDLALQWETTLPLPADIEETYKIKSLGVLITSHSVKKNRGGTIVVGGNFGHKTHTTKELPVEKLE